MLTGTMANGRRTKKTEMEKLATERLFPPSPNRVWVSSGRKISRDQRGRKIGFENYDATVGESSVGHPAPDPMLLVAKAANYWASAHHQRQLAVAEGGEDDDDMSEGFIMEMESHLKHLDGLKRKQMGRDVPGMVIEW